MFIVELSRWLVKKIVFFTNKSHFITNNYAITVLNKSVRLPMLLSRFCRNIRTNLYGVVLLYSYANIICRCLKKENITLDHLRRRSKFEKQELRFIVYNREQ